MPESITRLAPAKLNLALHVTGQRSDGYHLIDSLVAFADFGDIITVSDSDADELRVTGHYAPMVPINENNLVVAARDLLRAQYADRELAPVRIHLDKRLPVASGVGGGSSDAAAAIKALAEHWSIEPDFDALAAAALPLGADMPMCLAARPLIAQGIGDMLEPVEPFAGVDAVLVNPGLPVSTPEVFRTLEKRDNPALPQPPALTGASQLGGFLSETRNDLQEPALALCPMIGDALDTLRDNGALFARMSGSGATCFGLFDNPGPAAAAADRIAKQHPSWFVEGCRIMGHDANGGN